MSGLWERPVIIVTVHEGTGTAIVTGPAKQGMWQHLALEANPAAEWNDEWYGWKLTSLAQVADLCTLADIHNAVWRERKWTPDLLSQIKARQRKAASRPRARKT